uniref:Dynein heavy chain AAA 5 extension domain-containing protein n=1 Tax=Timema bartmani TaxID=61472 RepID=A0A7R9EUV8_9NEOP|nr:unnamed protein product [Timema bartmani]
MKERGNDLGGRYVTTWIENRSIQSEKSNLVILFDKYIPPCLENLRVRFKKITAVAEISHIQMLCHLLHCLLTPVNTPPGTSDTPQEHVTIHRYIRHSTGTSDTPQVHVTIHRYIRHSTGTSDTPQEHVTIHRYIRHSTGTCDNTQVHPTLHRNM